MNTFTEKFAFLTSTRFWALIVGAVAIYLSSKGIIGESERNLIATVMSIFIGVKTIDRVSEKIGGTTETTNSNL